MNETLMIGDEVIWEYVAIEPVYFKPITMTDEGKIIDILVPNQGVRKWLAKEKWHGEIDLSILNDKKFDEETVYVVESSSSRWIVGKDSKSIKRK